MELLEGAKAKLSVIALKAILCDLIGFSFKDYNINRAEFKQQQQVINDSIVLINNGIDNLNNAENLTGVKWSFHVHKLRHGRRGHRYTNTLSDGLHFSNETKDKFTKYLCATFYPNIHITCLNGRAVFEADHKRKPDLMPYRSQNDPRFDVRT